MYRKQLVLLMVLVTSGCVSAPPTNISNICEIFSEKKGWYKSAKKSSQKWGTDIAVMMAMIHQESSFRARAKPPRKKILGVIPGRRPASAYGYAQAIDSTWAIYKRSTGNPGQRPEIQIGGAGCAQLGRCAQ